MLLKKSNKYLTSFVFSIVFIHLAHVSIAQVGKTKIFRYNQTGGLTSLDPAFANKRANIWAVTQLYNGLFRFGRSNRVAPDLVNKWEVTEDGKTYTFHIKKGIKFHNHGVFANHARREVVAADFVYTYRRILNPETKSPGVWIFKDKVLRNSNNSISDTCFRAVGRYSFRVYLHQRFDHLPQLLAMPYTFVVPHEAVTRYGKEFGKNPVGTGAFRFVLWKPNKLLLLKKNLLYWKFSYDGKKLPLMDEVRISFIEDRKKAFKMFTQGKLDFLTGTIESSADLLLDEDGTVKEKWLGKFTVEKAPYMNTEYIGFAFEHPGEQKLWTNKKLRLALSYAINREGLVNKLRNQVGIPGHYGIVPEVISYSTRAKGYRYNIVKARKLLKEAGYPEGKGLPTITLHTHLADKKLAEYLQSQWRYIGVNVVINRQKFSKHQQKVDAGKAGLFRGSWLGDYPDPENYLAMFYSKNFAPHGPNKTHYQNPQFDQLFEAARATQSSSTRHSAYRKMDQMIMDEAAVIVLYYDENIWLKQNNIEGLETNPMNNLILEGVHQK
ncbi:ABC transporter substrate-binding protein [uncultured Microscilla sp.]|uniref:ABC transporter substrate-binding protein n=1 Tax=uncultured Microscilla sp. TaxID=432653 RepID=UPI002615A3CF|nr:ABC transporter substrate-binding protein [uncultured Microscilla sp.]